MGARKKSAPKRGSLAYTPRKRAKSLNPDIKYWPNIDIDKPILLGFGGYKAGMTHVYYVDEYKFSPYKGQEVFSAATIVETPPIYGLGLVAYGVNKKLNALTTLTTIIHPNIPDYIKRRIPNITSRDFDRKIEDLKSKVDEIVYLRLLASMQPVKAGIHKKTPEIFEIQIGGNVDMASKLEYGISLLGREISVNEVFKPGDVIDVIAVTKGKGFQGPVKRWGIKLLSHKSRKARRKPGALGPWKPSATRYTVPLAGQTGFHRRTIYHVKILDIREPNDFSKSLAFHKYGVLKSSFLVLKGSVPGPAKRLIKMRFTVRPVREDMKTPVKITYFNL